MCSRQYLLKLVCDVSARTRPQAALQRGSLLRHRLIKDSSDERVRHGQRNKAWKSMEELRIEGPSYECSKWPLSLPSSPTPSASVLLQSSSIFPSAAKAGHISSLKGIEPQEISAAQVVTASEHYCEELPSLKIDSQLQESSCVSFSGFAGASIAEHASHVKSHPEPQVDSTSHGPDEIEHPSHGPDEVEHPSRQNYMDSHISGSAPLEQAFQPNDTESLEASTNKLESSDETAEPLQQPFVIQQEGMMHGSAHSRSANCTQRDYAELKEPIMHTSHGVNNNQQHGNTTLSDACSQILIQPTKEVEETEHASEDTERVSQVNNVDYQELQSYVSTPPKRTDYAKHASLLMEQSTLQSPDPEVTLDEHLRQDQTARNGEEVSMRNFIMCRFLPAAQEVAAIEHESSATSLASRKQAAAMSSSPIKPERIPIAHRIKSRAHQVTKGFTSMHPLHRRQQEDVMPQSMKSCGFFCIGLKNALFRAQRTVSASTCAASRKKSWGSHLSSHVKVADEVSSLISSRSKGDAEVMEDLSKHPNESCTYSPPSSPETPRRHAMKYHANLSNDGCAGTGHSSSECNHPPRSLSEKLDVASETYKQMASTDGPPFDLLSMASRRQEEVKMPNSRNLCHCDDGESLCMHDLGKVNITKSPSKIRNCGIQLKSCLAQEQAQQDQYEDEDDEPQFFDALSRLNSVRSNASFYTVGSPKSQSDCLSLQNEWVTVKDESGFTDALGQFETPQASVSENKSVLPHPQVGHVMHANGEPLSLSQRFGKALKLETCEYMSSESGPICQSPHFDREGILQMESFSRLHHGSFDSLCPSDAGTVSPIFPAKCQSGSSSLGWPFGISTYQSSGIEGSPHNVHQEKRIEKYASGLNVPSPPLPPSPKGAWLGKALSKNASKTSPLATLQQKDKVAAARRKLEFLVTNAHEERRWEDVVKGSQIQTGHLRFSEELHQHHPLNQSGLQPLKL